MKMVAEGVNTTRVAMELADEYEVSMPITSEMYGVLYEGNPPEKAFRGLLRSVPTTELEPG
jgi:glycerol-3-phosphate dehydrogenase (NAD(P)+)